MTDGPSLKREEITLKITRAQGEFLWWLLDGEKNRLRKLDHIKHVKQIEQRLEKALDDK